MTRVKDKIEPISEKILLSEYYANKYDAYGSMIDAFEYRSQKDGFTQGTLVSLLGVSKGVVSRWLNGSANLTLKTLSNMATAMKCRLIIAFEPYDEKLPKRNWQSPYETEAEVQWSEGTHRAAQI